MDNISVPVPYMNVVVKSIASTRARTFYLIIERAIRLATSFGDNCIGSKIL